MDNERERNIYGFNSTGFVFFPDMTKNFSVVVLTHFKKQRSCICRAIT
ncbi:hypothetical protein ERO13_A11G263500v2 [Gossypium hirsutum]|uniref:Uncharacterized protein n=3 Tax=Gossypium TaxID=3633 RepID=A0A5D2XC90_GOSMU|nr:hypothetical protein ERO13_A11G263500v2 [Gossypium hirsutum]TYG95931.1 hypothetical protein ES288_A11G307900v1 [Gossypium darwinii]TYI02965.1 hypothetical protein ES332_A11G304600v1 [Gossypium tomentosum]TYJ11619.1 hypothetical protein E1A91_A11G288800v1 [Gossypium mustelinum]